MHKCVCIISLYMCVISGRQFTTKVVALVTTVYTVLPIKGMFKPICSLCMTIFVYFHWEMLFVACCGHSVISHLWV